ncbi:MAG: hypothetical protein R6V12_08080, partial [Candidatus Hydrogenedentota bacterium]
MAHVSLPRKSLFALKWFHAHTVTGGGFFNPSASEWGGFERVDLKTRGPLFENPNLDSVSILLERRIGKDLYLS